MGMYETPVVLNEVTKEKLQNDTEVEKKLSEDCECCEKIGAEAYVKSGTKERDMSRAVLDILEEPVISEKLGQRINDSDHEYRKHSGAGRVSLLSEKEIRDMLNHMS